MRLVGKICITISLPECEILQLYGQSSDNNLFQIITTTTNNRQNKIISE